MNAAQKTFIEAIVHEVLKREVINPVIEDLFGMEHGSLHDERAMQRRITAAALKLEGISVH